MSLSISCNVRSVLGLMAIAEAGRSVEAGRHDDFDVVFGFDDFFGIVGGLLEVVADVVLVDVLRLKVSTEELRLSVVVFSSRLNGGWGGEEVW